MNDKKNGMSDAVKIAIIAGVIVVVVGLMFIGFTAMQNEADKGFVDKLGDRVLEEIR